MDQIVPRLLRFDRFALDLTRGCLRAGDQQIALRPKAFELLRHLAENDGRLVSKQELFEVVWPNVTVTDDTLVQCIRELRDKLGDTDHRLIRTVPRRGYLLDATGTQSDDAPEDLVRTQFEISAPAPKARSATPSIPRRYRPARWAAALVAAGCIIAAAYFGYHRLSPSTANVLFTEHDARRIAAIATEKELPLPPFQVSRIERDVAGEYRRFVGIWVSSTGFVNSSRQFMLVVTHAEWPGILTGFTVRGPPQALSFLKAPAGVYHFKARVLGNSFRYGGSGGEREVVLTPDNRVEYNEVFSTGVTAHVVLDPVWTLVEAERATMQMSAR
jgi:DNA-binding winged helix-turn-helix (wHTH) protein